MSAMNMQQTCPIFNLSLPCPNRSFTKTSVINFFRSTVSKIIKLNDLLAIRTKIDPNLVLPPFQGVGNDASK